MALAERAQLIASLDLVDNLSPGLAKADASLIRMNGAMTQTQQKAGGLGTAFNSAAGLVKGLGASFVAFKGAEFLSSSIDAARDLNESLSKSRVIFGDAAAGVEQFSKAAESFGLSTQAALEASASFGNLFKATGTAPEQIAPMSEALVTLAGDLASFNNIPVDEALQKLRSGLVGEAEPLRAVGVLLTEAAVSAKAAELGFTKVNGVFTEAQKVQARYALILEQTKTAQGDAAKTGDELAGSQRRLDAAVTNLQASLGQKLTPALTDATNAAVTAVNSFDAMPAAFDTIGAAIGFLQDQVSNPLDTEGNARKYAEELAFIAVKYSDVTTASREGEDGIHHFGAAIESTTIPVQNLGSAIDDTVAKITNIDELTSSFDDDTDAINRAWQAAQDLRDELNAIPTDITVNIRLKTIAEGAGGRNVEEKVGRRTDTDTPETAAQATDFLNDIKNRRDKADADRARARDKANADAKRDRDQRIADAKDEANRIASVNRDKVASSYDDVKRRSDSLFDTLHDRHVKAIKDSEDLAEKNHDAAVQTIADTLAAQKAVNAAPVTAAEKALSERQTNQQRRDLVEGVQAAQAALASNRDRTRTEDLGRALRDATESLQNFDAQQAINKLDAARDLKDKAAEDAAKTARDKADADLEAAKTQAAADLTFTTKQDKKRKDDFDLALAKLKKQDEGSPTKFLTDVKALQAKFGIFTDTAGFTHIGDVVADAIKTTKPDVKLTLLVPRGAITLNGRDVNNASTVSISPTQAQSARSGNARPRT